MRTVFFMSREDIDVMDSLAQDWSTTRSGALRVILRAVKDGRLFVQPLGTLTWEKLTMFMDSNRRGEVTALSQDVATRTVKRLLYENGFLPSPD